MAQWHGPGHGVQASDPAVLYCPGGHVPVHVATDMPSDVPLVPAGHSWQEVNPREVVYVPRGHRTPTGDEAPSGQ